MADPESNRDTSGYPSVLGPTMSGALQVGSYSGLERQSLSAPAIILWEYFCRIFAFLLRPWLSLAAPYLVFNQSLFCFSMARYRVSINCGGNWNQTSLSTTRTMSPSPI